MSKVKFCGIRRDIDVEYVNHLKPEYIGFVFFEKSKRYVSLEQALRLSEKLDKDIVSCGVFVDSDISYIKKLYDEGVISIAQLHGSEDNEYIDRLRATVPSLQIIKAYIIRDRDDIEKANKSRADYILLDSGQGSGESFDWDILRGFDRDYFLAGGLNPENVIEAIENLHPYALDVSSGIETDGYKDLDKMERFIHYVRNH